MSQSYFIGALQNPSKTATIQWLIFDETPFLHQADLFKGFFPLDGMSSQKAQFCLQSVRFVFWAPTAVRQRRPLLTYFQLGFLGNVLQVVFEVTHGLLEIFFRGVCSKKSDCFSFNRASLKAWWVARGIDPQILGRIWIQGWFGGTPALN